MNGIETELNLINDWAEIWDLIDSYVYTNYPIEYYWTRSNNKIRRSPFDPSIKSVEEKIPYVKVNGHREKRLPGNANISFQFIEGESLLLNLDMKGICASSGSACTSGSLDPSHVLLAIGLPHEIAHGSLRVTFGEENTKEDVDFLVDTLVESVDRLRKMSPLYEDFIKNK